LSPSTTEGQHKDEFAVVNTVYLTSPFRFTDPNEDVSGLILDLNSQGCISVGINDEVSHSSYGGAGILDRNRNGDLDSVQVSESSHASGVGLRPGLRDRAAVGCAAGFKETVRHLVHPIEESSAAASTSGAPECG